MNRETEVLPVRFSDLRLRHHADFQLVYKGARKQYAREMSFFYRLRAVLPGHKTAEQVTAGPRIGLTVGKVLGKAHDRNRIKRRLRQAVRMHAPLLQGLPVDVVLHPRRSVLVQKWPSLEAEVAQIFSTVRRAAAKQALPVPSPTEP